MTTRTRLLPRRARLGAAAMLAALAALLPIVASAHPLGNFTVNRYSRAEIGSAEVRVLYVVDMAEIPALQERQRMDADGDGALSQNEQEAYRAASAAELGRNLVLSVDGQQLALAAEDTALSFPPGQGGLSTLRLEARFRASLSAGAQARTGELRDMNFADRIGWSEMIVRADGATLRESSVPAQGSSDELRNYPTDLLQTPPSVTSARFVFVAGGPERAESTNPSPISTGSPQGSYPQMGKPVDNFAALVATPLNGPLGVLIALGAAMGLGAAHALAPGHGKTIVAAYLVGARGTPWHALFLGLTTTITHTAGVFALGLITLFISRFVLPERLYPWLGVASGLMVVLIGWGLLRARVGALRGASMAGQRPHDHEASGLHSHGFGIYHSHSTPAATSGQQSSMRNLLLLGVSGGLIPCPSALVVLLGAIALGRVGFGLMLITAFSFGLAGVLTLVGLALVYARRLFERVPARGFAFGLLPVASAVVVIFAGGAITAQALLTVFQQ